MDDHQSRHSEEKKKKKKKTHKETGELGPEAASSPLSGGLQVTALSSPAVDDAAALQKRNEKKARKLFHLQNQNASTGEDPAEKPFSEETKKKKEEKKKKRDPLKLEELHNLHLEDRSLRKNIASEQKEFQNSDKRDLRRDNGEKKRSKKKKGEHEKDQHSEEGTLLGKNNKEGEKRSKKKKEKEKKREEGKEVKTESPSQKMSTQLSGEDHEQAKEKKVRHTTMEIGMVGEGGNLGSNGSLKEDGSAASKARKPSKKARNTVQRGNSDPASEEDRGLLNNNIEHSQRPSADQSENGLDTSMSIVSRPKEKEKGKKKEGKRKRVTFQDHINVADEEHVRDIPNSASENSIVIAEEVWGVRFTADEDEILKDAVWNYIKSKGWDEQEGLNKVFNSQKHKDARNCWADIKLALPHRPRQAIRYRAHLLLEKGAHAGKWSEEEEQLLRRLQGEHGSKWREISALIDRHRTSIKEKWRSLKRMKAKGAWTQGELQQLSDLVHKCLRVKAASPMDNKESDRHILRDDINWEKIADTIGTHNHGSCCGKWYYNLQSSLVTEGLWANEDDLLLLESLLESGACVEEEVEWDSLLNHRSGHVCVTRWKQMVKQLGENRTRQFLDKLDILARRYAPELLESSVQEMSIENSSVKENPSTTSAKISDA